MIEVYDESVFTKAPDGIVDGIDAVFPFALYRDNVIRVQRQSVRYGRS
jgi:hypothetical protein